MKVGYFKSLLFAGFCLFCAVSACFSTTIFSNYGQIQNVQNYSSNPFWNPNSPYNQKMPQPVYAQGADLNTEDCYNVVQPLVAVQCMTRDNCKDTPLNDIRPEIMVQLSKLPGNNYVSACAGYIDGVYEAYVKQYGNSLPTKQVAFPTATAPNPDLNNNGVTIPNPYKQETPKWQQDIKERSMELQRLQQENGAGSEHLSAVDFPTTFEDLSFSDRMALKSADYEQYKDLKAFKTINLVSLDAYCSEHSEHPDCQSNKIVSNTSDGSSSPNTTNNGNQHATDPNNPDIEKKFRIALLFSPDAKKHVGDIVSENDSSLADWYYDSDCSDHLIWASISDDAAVNKEAQKVFNEYGGSESDFYLDFPKRQGTMLFPGLLCAAVGHGGTWTAPRSYAAKTHNHIVMYRDQQTAQTRLNTFTDLLKDSKCSGLYVYLVALDVDDKGEVAESRLGSTFEDNGNYNTWTNIQSSKIHKVKVLTEARKI